MHSLALFLRVVHFCSVGDAMTTGKAAACRAVRNVFLAFKKLIHNVLMYHICVYTCICRRPYRTSSLSCIFTPVKWYQFGTLWPCFYLILKELRSLFSLARSLDDAFHVAYCQQALLKKYDLIYWGIEALKIRGAR